MATTMFFEGMLKDKGGKTEPVKLEFGRSSYYGGENLIYFVIDGKTLIVDEETGRKIAEGMSSLAAYLRYDE